MGSQPGKMQRKTNRNIEAIKKTREDANLGILSHQFCPIKVTEAFQLFLLVVNSLRHSPHLNPLPFAISYPNRSCALHTLCIRIEKGIWHLSWLRAKVVELRAVFGVMLGVSADISVIIYGAFD